MALHQNLLKYLLILMSLPKTISKKFTSQKNKYKSCLLIGISYKKNIDDLRESPSLEVFNLIHQNLKNRLS